jgi:hypothetical protein
MPTHPQATGALRSSSLQWAENELSSLDIKDPRRANRLKRMAADLHAHPGWSIPQSSGSPAAAKAAYRLIEGGSIRAEEVLSVHANATTRRVRGSTEQVLLVAQDTTTLNFASRPNTTGLGPIGNKADSGHGFFVHSSLCIGALGGDVFGLLGAEIWARDARGFKAGPAGARNRKPIEEKESFRWLQSWQKAQELFEQLGGSRQVVSVTDREGDIYEAFALCLDTKHRNGAGADLLVRAQHDRQQVGESGGGASWERIEQLEEAVVHTIDVPRGPGRPARKARLEVRWGKVELAVPAHKNKYLGLEKPLALWLVVAREVSPPKGEEPICWRLWTTMEIETRQCAIQTLGWYAKRWQIEEFHRVLKSGCKCEKRQLESLAKLSLVVSLAMVVAACILGLTKAARNQPDADVSPWLSEEQWTALHCYIHKTQGIPQQPPTLKTAVMWIASLGGFLGRKGDGFPGPQVLWRGWRRLEDITAIFSILSRQETCGQ